MYALLLLIGDSVAAHAAFILMCRLLHLSSLALQMMSMPRLKLLGTTLLYLQPPQRVLICTCAVFSISSMIVESTSVLLKTFNAFWSATYARAGGDSSTHSNMLSSRAGESCNLGDACLVVDALGEEVYLQQVYN